jgi:hypothetical protein
MLVALDTSKSLPKCHWLTSSGSQVVPIVGVWLGRMRQRIVIATFFLTTTLVSSCMLRIQNLQTTITSMLLTSRSSCTVYLSVSIRSRSLLGRHHSFAHKDQQQRRLETSGAWCFRSALCPRVFALFPHVSFSVFAFFVLCPHVVAVSTCRCSVSTCCCSVSTCLCSVSMCRCCVHVSLLYVHVFLLCVHVSFSRVVGELPHCCHGDQPCRAWQAEMRPVLARAHRFVCSNRGT